MASGKHSHNWVVDRVITNISGRRMSTTTYYRCSGCPLTRQENNVSGETKVRKRPCGSCPYRRDVPSGVWAEEEYEKLRAYDGTIAEQATAGASRLFMCHQADGNLCAGWAGCHGMRDLFAARLHAGELDLSVWDYESPVPVFSSGAEAADHGEADIDWPSPESEAAAGKIMRVREARGTPARDPRCG